MFPHGSHRQTGAITVPPALRRAAALARAFILLEDSELAVTAGDELSGARGPAGELEHPHRVPPPSRLGARRPGAGVPRPQPCLTPIERTRVLTGATTSTSRPRAARLK
jgi:hypothetical protein